jgi:hypothetical protein
MFTKIYKAFLGLLIMPFRIRVFRPDQFFRGKRVAIVGPADSTYDQENGAFIEGFDVVIRMNKTLVTWNKDDEKYLGKRTDVLFHSFYENMDSGGAGPLDLKLFRNFGVRYLIQPRFDKAGWRLMFNYFKKYLNTRDTIYILPYNYYQRITSLFDDYHPTRGFYALYSALTTSCAEVFITGFTFFKTPYAKGYRDNMRDVTANTEHIVKQGFHDINLEYTNFLKLLEETPNTSILVDEKLYAILHTDSPELAMRVKKVKTQPSGMFAGEDSI